MFIGFGRHGRGPSHRGDRSLHGSSCANSGNETWPSHVGSERIRSCGGGIVRARGPETVVSGSTADQIDHKI
ncbi:hypothetical protein AZ25_2794 [Bordetella holmesii 04P3421]|nr:hypothetical protein D558_1981 [Bordetella holmesii 44057]KAK75935.1 hypothetical protein L573_2647 [Bordetella holmesii H620]KCV13044.1 hypothetical protein AZ25_2794 [Bordetella holmesii 04P3421]